MKLKTVFSASLLVGGVAFADSTDVTTGYTIGVLPLTVSTSEVIISVPWIESGNTEGGISVANFVKTAGLTPATLKEGVPDAENMGDTLHWYNPSTGVYSSWYINNNAWVACDGTGSVDPATKSMARGDAVLVKLSSTPKTLYVVGQVSNDSASTTIATGTSDTPTFTLLASPDPSTPLTVNSKFTKSIAAEGDTITYLDTTASKVRKVVAKMVDSEIKWGYYSWTSSGEEFTEVPSITISAGQGFWYGRCSAGTSVTW